MCAVYLYVYSIEKGVQRFDVWDSCEDLYMRRGAIMPMRHSHKCVRENSKSAYSLSALTYRYTFVKVVVRKVDVHSRSVVKCKNVILA